MPLPRIGGETPIIKYGTELSVEAPTGTNAATPVTAGDILKLGGTGADGTGYKAAAAVAADSPNTAILLMALHTVNDINVPLGVKVIGMLGCQVRRLKYVSGAAPTIGQSVTISATNVRRIAGKAFVAGSGYVLAVDASALDAEVFV